MKSSSSAQVISDPLKQKQQIDILKELHRPLEGNFIFLFFLITARMITSISIKFTNRALESLQTVH